MTPREQEEFLVRVVKAWNGPVGVEVQDILSRYRTQAIYMRRDIQEMSKKDRSEDAARKALARAVFIAQHLHQMIPRDVWRDHGAEWMGHYEGDFHAEKVKEELDALEALAKGEA